MDQRLLKILLIRSAEVALALGLVFLLALLWGRHQIRVWPEAEVDKTTTSPQAAEGLSSSGALGGSARTGDDKNSGAGTLGQQQIASYFSQEDDPSVAPALDIGDGVSGLKSSASLTEFFRLLRQTSIKKSYDFGSGGVSFGFLTTTSRVQNLMLYPTPAQLISLFRRLNPTLAVSFVEARSDALKKNKDDVTLAGGVVLDKHPDVLIVTPQKDSVVRQIKGGDLICKNSQCGLDLHGDAIAVDGGLRAIFLGAFKALKPQFVIGSHDSSSRFVWGLLDIDGDGQYDASIYTGLVNSALAIADLVYVATNDDGHWRLRFIRENDNDSSDAPRFDPEPGEYNEPVIVRIYSTKSQGLAVSVDGSEPDCVSAAKKGKVVEEAEILVEKTTSIAAKSCAPSSQEATLSARYIINGKAL